MEMLNLNCFPSFSVVTVEEPLKMEEEPKLNSFHTFTRRYGCFYERKAFVYKPQTMFIRENIRRSVSKIVVNEEW